mmetsp:Transcript_31729/g.35979  ORF Transcript_31729/g.35979 Transcript_31729/m.35979 type:complete len:170 (-) Transcript_31729:102-611(-)
MPMNNTTNITTTTTQNQYARRLKKRETKRKPKQKKESTTKSLSFRDEHGPRAGRGYWEDVALAIHARHGMIAFHMHHRKDNLVRTSTALVRELVEFRRLVEYYYYSSDNDADTNEEKEDKDQVSSLPDFVECTTPWEKGSRKKKRNGGGEDKNRKKKRKATREKKSLPT